MPIFGPMLLNQIQRNLLENLIFHFPRKIYNHFTVFFVFFEIPKVFSLFGQFSKKNSFPNFSEANMVRKLEYFLTFNFLENLTILKIFDICVFLLNVGHLPNFHLYQLSKFSNPLLLGLKCGDILSIKKKDFLPISIIFCAIFFKFPYS